VSSAFRNNASSYANPSACFVSVFWLTPPLIFAIAELYPYVMMRADGMSSCSNLKGQNDPGFADHVPRASPVNPWTKTKLNVISTSLLVKLERLGQQTQRFFLLLYHHSTL